MRYAVVPTFVQSQNQFKIIPKSPQLLSAALAAVAPAGQRLAQLPLYSEAREGGRGGCGSEPKPN